VGELVGGGGDLWFYQVKHARENYRNRPGEASRNIGRFIAALKGRRLRLAFCRERQMR
jgi:hypothetical protein